MRLHELAKEIGAESKKLLAMAKELGLSKVRNHSSNLAAGEVALLRAAWRETEGDTAPPSTSESAATETKSPPRKRRRRGTTDAATADVAEGGADALSDSATEVAEGSAPVLDEQTTYTVIEEEPVEQPVEEAPVEEPEVPAAAVEAAVTPAADTATADAAKSEEGAADTSTSTEGAAGSKEAGSKEPGSKEPGSKEPGSKAPGTAEAGKAAALAKEPAAKAADATATPAAAGAGATTIKKPAPEKTADAVTSGGALRPAARGSSLLRKNIPDVGPRPSRATKPPLRPAISTGKPEQTPTPRRKVGGAKILGRIELPKEEIDRARTRPPSPNEDVPDPDRPGAGRGIRGGPPTRETMEQRARRNANRPREDMGSTWSPDDEDDPLLQGIRVQNVQRGPHTRRPPRRVGPRKSGRRPRPVAPSGPVAVECPISVRALSQELGVKVRDILRAMMSGGTMDGHAEMALDEEAVLEIATSLNREVNTSLQQGKEDMFLAEVDAAAKVLAAKGGSERTVPLRPPIVAFLGHVDHGKTSLLDFIRKADVAGGEAGGITQSMRAYSVASTGAAGSITLLDTPGHKAFTKMRARGAKVTDIVVLVVAADDGVMPQTQEAIQHALAANCPIVVAVNKCDRAEANVDRVLQQLSQESVAVEGWGGEVQYARCSAITGEGIDDLLEKIALQAEIMELTADPEREAVGVVLEAHKDDKLGAVATVLVQEGTLRTGDVILSGNAFGRSRKLVNDLGRSVKEAGPSMPVNVIGFNEAPNVNEKFFELENLKKAREVAEEREHAERAERVSGPAPNATVTLDNLFESLEAGKAAELKVVLRCDVKGSLEVVRTSLEELDQKEVRIKIIRHALGGVTEDDVVLAIASEAVVIGFNVVADDKARREAEAHGIDLRTYQVIYELIDDVKAAMEGLLSPVKKENVVGHVEIREIFKVSRIGSIAGCRVTDGMIRRNSTVRLTRDGIILHTGGLDSLKRIKDDVREVREGLECGLHLSGYDDIKKGDILEVIEMAEERRTLDFAES